MLDFTRALYLGLRHPWDALTPWQQLTSGVPAALAEPYLAREVAAGLATLTGVSGAALAPSTLHLFWDLFGMIAMTQAAVHVDAGTYPTARWGAERAAARGVPTSVFGHHDPVALRRRLARTAAAGRSPVIVTDGLCPGCGGAAPLRQYAGLAREFGGLLVVDDTQALGILGEPDPGSPYGAGGGGSLRAADLAGGEVVVVASLAKGFGVPLAVLAAADGVVGRFTAHSETRVHASPPSYAHLHAGARALSVNRADGERLRRRLACLVARFRHRLDVAGLRPAGGAFPVQTLGPLSLDGAAALHRRLLRLGVLAVPHRLRCGPGAAVSLLITNLHCRADIDAAALALADAVRCVGQPSEVNDESTNAPERRPGPTAVLA